METNPKDLLEYQDGKPKMPTSINVLTILTFIGCAIILCSAVYGFYSSKNSYEHKQEYIEKMNSDQMPAWAKSMMGDPAHFDELITKSYENRLPILLLSLVSLALCLFGAIQMRKLNKQGFLIYTIGELLPFLTQFIFIGAFSFAGFGMYVGIGIAALFILLYAVNRKYLIY